MCLHGAKCTIPFILMQPDHVLKKFDFYLLTPRVHVVGVSDGKMFAAMLLHF